MASLQNEVKISSNRPFVLAELARVQAVAGNESEARAILKSLDDAAAENYISPVNRAKIHLGLSETDKVFEWLEQGFEERSVRMPYFMIDQQCDPIRSDERFLDITKRMGIA